MRCLVGLVSVLAVSSAALSIPPRPQQVVLESLRFSAFEARTMAVSGTLVGEQESKQLLIKGIVSRAAQELQVEEQGYATLEELTAQVQTTYCKSDFVPTGESTFNAGRNISASLGDYVPAQLRIEVSYYNVYFRGSRSATRTTTLVCPNSMRD